MGLNQIYPAFWINILQDLYGQAPHFHVLMQFLQSIREAVSRIIVGTCYESWLAQYGIASSLYFSERGFSVWKIWKFWRLYMFSLNLKISFFFFLVNREIYTGIKNKSVKCKIYTKKRKEKMQADIYLRKMSHQVTFKSLCREY